MLTRVLSESSYDVHSNTDVSQESVAAASLKYMQSLFSTLCDLRSTITDYGCMWLSHTCIYFSLTFQQAHTFQLGQARYSSFKLALQCSLTRMPINSFAATLTQSFIARQVLICQKAYKLNGLCNIITVMKTDYRLVWLPHIDWSGSEKPVINYMKL